MNSLSARRKAKCIIGGMLDTGTPWPRAPVQLCVAAASPKIKAMAVPELIRFMRTYPCD